MPTVEEMEASVAGAAKAANHRFQKGVSGNPRGRPRKIERSYTLRQQRRDVLRIAESPTTIRTAKSKTKKHSRTPASALPIIELGGMAMGIDRGKRYDGPVILNRLNAEQAASIGAELDVVERSKTLRSAHHERTLHNFS